MWTLIIILIMTPAGMHTEKRVQYGSRDACLVARAAVLEQEPATRALCVPSPEGRQ
jgi:hypothetical protein